MKSKKTANRLTYAALAAVMMFSSGMCGLSASADWQKTSSGYSYTDKSGKKVTGWQTIGGKKYYFTKKGTAKTGLNKVDGNVYYFNPNKKGEVTVGWKTVDGGKYYFDKDGKAVSGLKEISGYTYYFSPKTYKMTTTGWKTIDGGKYYFGIDGKAVTGFAKIGGDTYYFDPDNSGKAVTGTKTIDGKSYTFGSDGKLQQNTAETAKKATMGQADILGRFRLGVSTEDDVKNGIDLKGGESVDIDGKFAYSVYYGEASFFGFSKQRLVYVFNENGKLIGCYTGCSDEKIAEQMNNKLSSGFVFDNENKFTTHTELYYSGTDCVVWSDVNEYYAGFYAVTNKTYYDDFFKEYDAIATYAEF